MIPAWTPAETASLVKLRPVMSLKAIAAHLDKTYSSVSQKAFRMGIRGNDDRGRRKNPVPVQVTKWTHTYTEIYSIARRMHCKRVPLRIHSHWESAGRNAYQVFAVFRIYPTNIKQYWEQHGG